MSLRYIASLAALCCVSFSSVSAASFSDVPSSHRFVDAITHLSTEGIVRGYDNGTFRPNNNINRAEFMKIVAASTGILDEAKRTNCFSDVPENEWFTPSICSGKDAGIISGYPDGTFRPGDDINFVEALKIVEGAYNISYQKTDLWFEGMVRSAAAANLIPLSIRSFDQKLSRGEMADMIARFIFHKKNALSDFLKTRASHKVTFETIQNGKDVFADWHRAQYSSSGSINDHLVLKNRGGKKYTGDGSYSITTNDQITLNNGVTVEIDSVRNTTENEFVIKVNYYLNGVRLNYFPLSLGHKNTEYGTYLEITLLRPVDADPNYFTIMFQSRESNVALQSLFDSCTQSSKPRHECFSAATFTPLSGESMIEDSSFRIIYPQGEDALAYYFLGQMHHCKAALEEQTDMSFAYNFMPLRLYYDGFDQAVKANFSGIFWPIKPDQSNHPRIITNATTCYERIVAHELMHIAVLPAFFEDVLNEGIAFYHENSIIDTIYDAKTTVLAQSREMEKDDSFTDDRLGITATYLGLSKESDDIVVFAIEDAQGRFSKKSIGIGLNTGASTDEWTSTEDNFVIFIENIDTGASKVTASFFRSPPSRKFLTCHDNGYEIAHGWRTQGGKIMPFFQYQEYDLSTKQQPAEKKNFISLQNYLSPNYPWSETFDIFYAGGACLLRKAQKENINTMKTVYAVLSEYKSKSVTSKKDLTNDLVKRLGENFASIARDFGLIN